MKRCMQCGYVVSGDYDYCETCANEIIIKLNNEIKNLNEKIEILRAKNRKVGSERSAFKKEVKRLKAKKMKVRMLEKIIDKNLNNINNQSGKISKQICNDIVANSSYNREQKMYYIKCDVLRNILSKYNNINEE